jgi:hypothetical protein
MLGRIFSARKGTLQLIILASFAIFWTAVPAKAQLETPGLIISEFLANPAGTDSPFEYIELVATESIDFSVTPFSVVVSDGATNADGWIAGGTMTYGFSITSGTVEPGEVVYVGGSSMTPTGKKLRVIDTGVTPGDRFGDPRANGVVGNGGATADGIAVFAAHIDTLTSSTVPVDALFYGTSTGNAVVANGAAGFELPYNDHYQGGKLLPNSFLGPDPGSGQVVVASGVYDIKKATFTTPRTWSIGPATDNVSGVEVIIPVNEPITLTCPAALFSEPGIGASIDITAVDPDGIVSAPQMISAPITGISLTNASGATEVGGTARATLNLGTNTPEGTHTVTIKVQNNDDPPLEATCDITVGFVENTTQVYLPIIRKEK